MKVPAVWFLGWLVRVAAATVLSTAVAKGALAADPRVTFDVAAAVACRDVTDESFAVSNPHERLIEARLHVSCLLLAGAEADLNELLVTVSSPQRRLRVVDFSPQTLVAAEYAEPIAVETSEQTSTSIEARLGGSAAVHYGGGTVQAAPHLGAVTSRHQGQKETAQKLPPKHLVLASGTLNGGHGVFFKLKQTNQATLEGARQFTCVFAVPRSWRGDWVLVTCQARGLVSHYLSKRLDIFGHTESYVGLYLEDDAAARRFALRLAEVQGPAASAAFVSQREEVATLEARRAAGRSGDATAFWDSIGRVLGLDRAAGESTVKHRVLSARDQLADLSGW